jgi:hypothetical protein
MVRLSNVTDFERFSGKNFAFLVGKGFVCSCMGLEFDTLEVDRSGSLIPLTQRLY